MVRVFLDAGHGGKDSGARSNGLLEKDIVLSVTLKVGNILKNHGVDVIYSRTRDIFLELAKRASKANKASTNIFVSIHCNSSTSTTARGVETYSYPGSMAGMKLSKLIQASMTGSSAYTLNRGSKTANFAVLRLTNMPAALVELGFITNVQDSIILKSRQDELARAVAKGILSNLGIAYIGNWSNGSILYKVQVGAYSVKVNADNLANELKGKGYSPMIVTVGKLYKVQVGAFSVRKNADDLVKELKIKGYNALVVAG